MKQKTTRFSNNIKCAVTHVTHELIIEESSQQDTIKRLLQSIVREKLLPFEFLGNTLIIYFDASKKIIAESVHRHSLDRLSFNGVITCHE